MITAVLVLLAAVAGLGLVLTAIGERVRPLWGAAILAVLLGVGEYLAWRAAPASRPFQTAGTVLGALAAVAGGGPVATAVLRNADPTRAAMQGGPADPEVLRGGAWVGVLERAAVAALLLTGWPDGFTVLLAVKGLGRYAELKAPAAAERFIIGTLASLLWAAACVGCAVLLRF